MHTFKLIIALLPLNSEAHSPVGFPDIPPDADSSFYRSLVSQELLSQGLDGLGNVISLGERNLKWLEHINSFRPANEKLSFTSKDSQRGVPIDDPFEYNPPLIQRKLTDLRPQVPEAMRKILFDNREFTKEPPVEITEYLGWSRELDRIFQTALRWRTMAPWLGYLAGRRHNDLRGWYFLSRLENRAEKLRNFASLNPLLKAKIQGWLVNMCFNDSGSGDSPEECARSVSSMITNNHDLEAYYQSRAPHSSSMYAGYFNIPANAFRREVRWERGANGQVRVVAPFLDPGNVAVRAFLKNNIEDEWRFQDWRLELPFVAAGSVPRVVFRPGVTPNVNGLGGDTITMNSQQPLTEYDAQWTIRHEYGHVLGFPDCYVEFYEQERNTIVNYQFDIDNLMCSRRGHIQERHLIEMK